MKWPLVEICWVDSGSNGGWTDIKDLREIGLDVLTVGWMISEDEKSITLVSSIAFDIDDEPEQVTGGMTIPRVSIKRRRVIERAEKKR